MQLSTITERFVHSVPLIEKIGVDSVYMVILTVTMAEFMGSEAPCETTRLTALELLAPVLVCSITLQLTFATTLFYTVGSTRLVLVRGVINGVNRLAKKFSSIKFAVARIMQNTLFLCTMISNSKVPTMTARTLMGSDTLCDVLIVRTTAVRFAILLVVRLPGTKNRLAVTVVRVYFNTTRGRLRKKPTDRTCPTLR